MLQVLLECSGKLCCKCWRT